MADNKIPIYGFYKTQLGKGIIGGILINRYKHGEEIANIVTEEFKGSFSKKNKVIALNTGELFFDYNYMKMGNIELTEIPKKSKIINYTSAYQKYKYSIFIGTLIFILMSAIIILLILNIRKSRKMTKSANENITFIRTIIDSFPNVLSVRDSSGKVILANKAFAELFAGNSLQVEGKSFVEVIAMSKISTHEMIEYMKEDYDIIKEFQPKYGVEEKIVSADGSIRWFYTNKIPVALNGKNDFLIRISVDINKIKRMEEDLKEAKERAESANEAKSRFIANISHELRTPLNSIIGMADVLSQSNIPLKNKREAEIISKSSERLLNLINDVLDLTKIEAGVVNIENTLFSPRDEIRKCIEIFNDKAAKKGIILILAVKTDIGIRPRFVIYSLVCFKR